jgi:hypothetical protein
MVRALSGNSRAFPSRAGLVAGNSGGHKRATNSDIDMTPFIDLLMCTVADVAARTDGAIDIAEDQTRPLDKRRLGRTDARRPFAERSVLSTPARPPNARGRR